MREKRSSVFPTRAQNYNASLNLRPALVKVTNFDAIFTVKINNSFHENVQVCKIKIMSLT